MNFDEFSRDIKKMKFTVLLNLIKFFEDLVCKNM